MRRGTECQALSEIRSIVAGGPSAEQGALLCVRSWRTAVHVSRVRLSGRTYITALPLSLTRDNLPHPQPSQQHHRRDAELLHEQAPEP